MNQSLQDTTMNSTNVIDVSSVDYNQYSNKLSSLEVNILKQYQSINNNLKSISNELESFIHETTNITKNNEDINNKSTNITINNLRQIETKLGFIYTFFKGAVYTLYADHEQGEMEEQKDSNDDDDENLNEYVEGDEAHRDTNGYGKVEKKESNNTELSNRSYIS